MPAQVISRKPEPRNVILKLIDGSVIRGQVNLFHEQVMLHGVSDLFTKVKDPFIVLFGATVEGKPDQALIVNKQSIVWICPED